MLKRLKRSAQAETFFNGTRNDELNQPRKRRLAVKANKAATANCREKRAPPIPLPFIDEINDIFSDKPIQIPSKSDAINVGAENLFTHESKWTSTIPLPNMLDKPSTSRAFTFPDLVGTAQDATDSESASGTETSDDELASVSPLQVTGTPKIRKKKMTRSDYYRERLNQLDREQQDRRERWKKKLENMEKLLNFIKS